ncbi:MAG: hypothetical protein RIR62_1259 [Pseudomonadota bacterium]|jgi:hypothetical protein
MAFHQRSAAALDYLSCRYGRSRLLFRGPSRSLDRPFVAFLGGSETYGKFVPTPFPALCETATGRVSVNLGAMQAGPDVWLNDPAVLDVAARAAVTVVQIPGAVNLTNRLYSVHPRRNDRFLRASPLLQSLYREVDFTEFSFVRHMLGSLRAASPDKFGVLAEELRQAWQGRMKTVLSRLPGVKVLLWVGSAAPPAAGQALVPEGDAPLVDRAMIDAIRRHANEYVEVVTSPFARAQGTAGMVFDSSEEAAARGLPGPAAHAEIAGALAPVLRGLG